MRIAALIALTGWFIWYWELALVVSASCLILSLFYAGAAEGDASERVWKAFSTFVVAVTILMAGSWGAPVVLDALAPKMCGQMQC